MNHLPSSPPAFFLLSVSLGLAATVSPQVARAADAILHCPASVVYVQADWLDGHGVTGTGVLISGHHVLTAASVVNQGAKLRLYFGGRDGLDAVVDERPFNDFKITYVEGRDLVVIDGVKPLPNIAPAHLAQSRPHPGDYVVSVGLLEADAVRARSATLREETITQPKSWDMLAFNMPTENGDLGGPVFNGAGDLIGIVHGDIEWEENRLEGGLGKEGYYVRSWKGTVTAGLITPVWDLTELRQ